MDGTPDQGEVRSLKLLRVLVTVLTSVMIVGFLVLIALLVTRFPGGPSAPPLPGEIALPEGVTARAFTQGTDWYAVVTDGDEILVYDRATGLLRQRIRIAPADPDG